MSDVLDRLREARPSVAPPTEAAHRAARQRLLATIEDEPPELHALRVRDDAAGRPHAGRSASGASLRPRAASAVRSRLARAHAVLIPAVVVAIAAVVVVVAVVLPGHHRAASPGVVSGSHGGIDAQGGQSLSTGAAALPAVIVAGLRHQYRSELAGGRTLHTTIDAALQRTGMRSLRHSLTANRGSSGSFVVLDPETGAVEAIGTAGPRGHTARVDGAVSDATAPAGLFSPITALAALKAGAWTATESYDDTGEYCILKGRTCLHNAGNAAYGRLTLPQALAVQDEVFSAQLGARLNSSSPGGGALQRTARMLGIGQRTGVDLPGEASGTLPTPANLGTHGTWSVIDNVVLATGQGELTVTPIQLAVAYAAFTNGGTVVTPHLVAGITGAGSASHRAAFSSQALSTVREGLRENAEGPEAGRRTPGVTSQVFASLHDSIGGTAGTSEEVAHGRQTTDGWYAGYIDARGRRLVVVVRIRHGGFGDLSAAPVARQLFSQWATGRPGRWTPGSSVAQ